MVTVCSRTRGRMSYKRRPRLCPRGCHSLGEEADINQMATQTDGHRVSEPMIRVLDLIREVRCSGKQILEVAYGGCVWELPRGRWKEQSGIASTRTM